MPRSCTICTHDKRREVDLDLLHRVAYRDIARRFGVSKDALMRHSREHIPELLVKGYEALEEVSAGEELSRELSSVKADVHRLKAKAEAEGDIRTALSACDKALKALELQAKVAQIIATAPQVNLHISPEWLELRALIVGALEPHPEARVSVLRAIERVGNAG